MLLHTTKAQLLRLVPRFVASAIYMLGCMNTAPIMPLSPIFMAENGAMFRRKNAPYIYIERKHEGMNMIRCCPRVYLWERTGYRRCFAHIAAAHSAMQYGRAWLSLGQQTKPYFVVPRSLCSPSLFMITYAENPGLVLSSLITSSTSFTC